MRFQELGDKPGLGVEQVRSSETTITIKKGGPTLLTLSGTEDGLRVTSAEAAADALWNCFFGLAVTDIAPGQLGEVVNFGVYKYARVTLSTRSASTAVWVSYSAGAIGDALGIKTGAGEQALVRSVAATNTSFFPAMMLGFTYASATTSASSLGGTSTASVTTGAVFIRNI